MLGYEFQFGSREPNRCLPSTRGLSEHRGPFDLAGFLSVDLSEADALQMVGALFDLDSAQAQVVLERFKYISKKDGCA